MHNVTVIIPNWNGIGFLPDCMSALAAQTYTAFTTVVIDNGSTDGSVAWLRENCPDITLVENSENLGFTGAVNQGIAMTQTPYLILLNNDTAVAPGFVGALVKAIEASEKIFSVSSRMIQYHDHSKLDDAGDLYNILGWAFQRGVGQSVRRYRKPGRVFSACAGAAIYRTRVFDEIGMFDPMHFAYLEDLDVGWRARIHGYENRYEPAAVVYHVGSGTSGSKYNHFKVKLAARNNVYINYKNMPALQRAVNWLPIRLGQALKRRFFRKIGFEQDFLEGLAEAKATRKDCRRVPFRWEHLGNYLRIEGELIANLFVYTADYLRRKLS